METLVIKYDDGEVERLFILYKEKRKLYTYFPNRERFTFEKKRYYIRHNKNAYYKHSNPNFHTFFGDLIIYRSDGQKIKERKIPYLMNFIYKKYKKKHIEEMSKRWNEENFPEIPLL